MTKIRRISGAQDAIDKHFAWRLKEIANFKSMIKSADAIPQKSLIRAGIPLLYAHWEGFVKVASEVYLNFVANQRHQYSDLRLCFMVRGLKKRLDELEESRNSKRNVEILRFVLKESDKRASIPYKNAVDTKSNLNSKAFKNVALSIGIDPGPYETKYNFINESILRRRNMIAHGEYLDVGPNDYQNISDTTIGLMRQYKTDIENAIVLQSYKRPTD